MEDFIKNNLRPSETCIVCTEPFSQKHLPVALRCCHIFGYECIKKWLRDGRGNTNSCPACRHAMFDHTPTPAFDDASIWRALCAQRPERLHSFLTALWASVRNLWMGRLIGNCTTTELLETVVLRALSETADDFEGPFRDCINLVATSRDSLGRSDRAHSVAIPLVRLARLMSQASSVLPKWLASIDRISLLFWRANAALSMSEESINWGRIEEAAKLNSDRYLPLLHLYTILISQSIAHTEQPREWPKRRHEVMNLVVDRCCKRIGGDWNGRPSNAFKDTLALVYEELRRYQLEKRNKSLRGHNGEENIVRGLWSMAAWSRSNVGQPVRAKSTSPTGKRSSSGWNNGP